MAASLSGLLASAYQYQLNITVKPDDVRLITQPADEYRWAFLPAARYMFLKHLSKIVIGMYQDLIEKVGVSFEAVANTCRSEAQSGALALHVSCIDSHRLFNSDI